MFSLKSTLNTLQKISIICENKTLRTNNGSLSLMLTSIKLSKTQEKSYANRFKYQTVPVTLTA